MSGVSFIHMISIYIYIDECRVNIINIFFLLTFLLMAAAVVIQFYLYIHLCKA